MGTPAARLPVLLKSSVLLFDFEPEDVVARLGEWGLQLEIIGLLEGGDGQLEGGGTGDGLDVLVAPRAGLILGGCVVHDEAGAEGYRALRAGDAPDVLRGDGEEDVSGRLRYGGHETLVQERGQEGV